MQPSRSSYLTFVAMLLCLRLTASCGHSPAPLPPRPPAVVEVTPLPAVCNLPPRPTAPALEGSASGLADGPWLHYLVDGSVDPDPRTGSFTAEDDLRVKGDWIRSYVVYGAAWDAYGNAAEACVRSMRELHPVTAPATPATLPTHP